MVWDGAIPVIGKDEIGRLDEYLKLKEVEDVYNRKLI